jgi:predicted nuclease of predicted toxin-antitoxin system
VKLLFDQNLSWKLVRLLADVYEGCTHVRNLGMATAADTEIWRYAAEHGFTVVTKDADFLQRSLTLGFPPKVVWLRIGNCSVDASADLLREKYIRIRHFHDSDDAAVLTLP